MTSLSFILKFLATETAYKPTAAMEEVQHRVYSSNAYWVRYFGQAFVVSEEPSNLLTNDGIVNLYVLQINGWEERQHFRIDNSMVTMGRPTVPYVPSLASILEGDFEHIKDRSAWAGIPDDAKCYIRQNQLQDWVIVGYEKGQQFILHVYEADGEGDVLTEFTVDTSVIDFV
jgi:hypothetical protein